MKTENLNTKKTRNPGTREDLLRTLPIGSVGAELGVFCGEFSGRIADIVKPRRLFLVDLFEGIVTSGDANGERMRSVDMGALYVALQEQGLVKHQKQRKEMEDGRWEEWETRMEVVRANSWVWLKAVAMQYEYGGGHRLDWVYIDTDHTYETTRRELEWARKAVRNEGFICGHDFSEEFFPGVVRAVREFCEARGLTVEVWEGDRLPSYKIQNV